MAPFERPLTTYYQSAIVTIVMFFCELFDVE